jgi:hypothetical protein
MRHVLIALLLLLMIAAGPVEGISQTLEVERSVAFAAGLFEENSILASLLTIPDFLAGIFPASLVTLGISQAKWPKPSTWATIPPRAHQACSHVCTRQWSTTPCLPGPQFQRAPVGPRQPLRRR